MLTNQLKCEFCMSFKGWATSGTKNKRAKSQHYQYKWLGNLAERKDMTEYSAEKAKHKKKVNERKIEADYLGRRKEEKEKRITKKKRSFRSCDDELLPYANPLINSSQFILKYAITNDK